MKDREYFNTSVLFVSVMASWSDPLDYPLVRFRGRVLTSRGRPTEFMFQIEYNHNTNVLQDSEWRPVARMDHNENGAHDVRQEGLHLDIVGQRGHKIKQLKGFPQFPIQQAPAFCESFLKREWRRLVDEYEKGWPSYSSSSSP